MGGAVIGLGTVHHVGDVVLAAAVLDVDFRGEGRAAAALGGSSRFTGLRFRGRSFGSGDLCGDSSLFLGHSFYLLS